MAQKELNSRLILKHDIEANWVTAAARSNFTPKLGEIIIYDIDENYNHERFKIGDGVRNVEELPFYAGSWNDLTDKPFYEIEDNSPIEITWDGVIGDNFVIEEWAGFGDYYIGDYGITDYTQLLGSTVKLGDDTYTLDYCEPSDYSEGYYTFTSSEESYAKVILVTEVQPDNYPVGIYFYYTPDTYVSYLKTKPFEHSTIKTLDSKFIGSDIARVSEVVSKDNLEHTALLTKEQELTQLQQFYATNNLGILNDGYSHLSEFQLTFNSEGKCATDKFFKYMRYQGTLEGKLIYLLDYFDKETYESASYQGLFVIDYSGPAVEEYFDFGRFKAFNDYVLDTEANYDEWTIEVDLYAGEKVIKDTYIPKNYSWNDLIDRPFYDYTTTDPVSKYMDVKLSAFVEGNIFNYKFIENETYVVYWNYESFECVAKKDENGLVYLGNLFLVNSEMKDSLEPFCIFSHELDDYSGAYFLSYEATFDISYKDEIVVPQTQITSLENYGSNFISYIDLIPEQEYVVAIDGYEYICTAYDLGEGEIALGNSRFFNDEIEMGEDVPFAFISRSPDTVFFADHGTHIIHVKAKNKHFKSIDPKYLPEGGVGYGNEKITIVDNLTRTEYKKGNYPPCTFIIGEKYTITIDGNVYSDIECIESEGCGTLNGTLVDGTDFYISDNGGNSLYILIWSGWSTISIIQGIGIHKIDPKYVGTDWNINDPETAGYIKNRPFYEVAGVEAEYIPETTLSNFEQRYWSNSDPDTIYYISLTTTDYYTEFSLDKTYTVIWDGVRYDNVTCEDTMGGPMLGSSERQIAGVYGESNQYPFGIQMQYLDSSPELYVIAEEGGTHTVKVASISESYIKTLDPKFLPELVGKYTDTVKYSEIFNDYENNIADGYYSHAEGEFTAASGGASHAEGLQTVASGDASHAEGWETVASGTDSHAEGFFTEASGANSHAEGIGTIAKGNSQHAQGKYNIADNNTYAHIVGNGDSDSSRSNAHTIDWDGNANFAGDVYVGNANENKAGKKLATEEYVDNAVSNINVETSIPDWGQNDENAIDYIKNRPFYEDRGSDVTEKTITFNGDFSAQQIVGCPVQGYIKLSDDIPTKENFVGHNIKLFISQAGQSMEQEKNINNAENYLPDITFGDANFELIKGKGYTNDPYLIVVEEEMLVYLPSEIDFANESIQYDYFIMSPGIWTIFMDMTIVPEAAAAGEDYKVYLSEINYSYQEKSIKQLDSKYIPNNIVVDWDNINNRPFFEKIVYDDRVWTVTKDLILTFTDQGNGLYKSNKFDGGQQIKDNALYDLRVFYWDDTPYHCVKQVLEDGTTPYFGNRWIVDSTKENTGEPFYAIKAEDHSWAHGYLYVYTRKTEATHKFEVGPSEEFIYTKKIDEKYLPDTIAHKEDITDLQNLVGDTSVTEQIATAIANTEAKIEEIKTSVFDQVVLKDQVTNQNFVLCVRDGMLIATPVEG